MNPLEEPAPMGDLLVRLYDLPARPGEPEGVTIRRPLVPEKRVLSRWVEEHFGERWACEAERAFASHPVTCFVALGPDSRPVGFACYDCTFRGFFGPTGVEESARGRGIGTALLRRALEAMAESGYAYAVIGGASSAEYYTRTVGAIPIADSDPGAYARKMEG